MTSRCSCSFWKHMFVKNSLYITFTWSLNQFLFFSTFSFLFPQHVLLINSISCCFDNSVFTQLLANLISSFWFFLSFFQMSRMMVTLNKPRHLPHASRITNWGAIFTKTIFSVSNGWVRSWARVFWVTK